MPLLPHPKVDAALAPTKIDAILAALEIDATIEKSIQPLVRLKIDAAASMPKFDTAISISKINAAPAAPKIDEAASTHTGSIFSIEHLTHAQPQYKPTRARLHLIAINPPSSKTIPQTQKLPQLEPEQPQPNSAAFLPAATAPHMPKHAASVQTKSACTKNDSPT